MQNGDRVHMRGGVEGFGVDEVMVVDAVHGVVALVIAAGDHGKVRCAQRFTGAHAVQVLHAHHPEVASVQRLAAADHIAARVEQKRIQPVFPEGFAGQLRGVPLGHRAHVQRNAGVLKIDRTRILIQNDLIVIHVLCGLPESGFIGEDGSILAGVVPQLKHCAHGGIERAAVGLAPLAHDKKQVH